MTVMLFPRVAGLALALSLLCLAAGCGGGGGGVPSAPQAAAVLDASFLELQAPGTTEITSTPEFAANVYPPGGGSA